MIRNMFMSISISRDGAVWFSQEWPIVSLDGAFLVYLSIIFFRILLVTVKKNPPFMGLMV